MKKYKSPIGGGLITVLFFLSGAVSLLYEIVWAKQLQFLFGSSIYSISTIISSFFGGMALGSYLLGKWKPKKDPILIYGTIEIAIGLFCMVSFFLIEIADNIYLYLAAGSLANSFVLSLFVKFLLSFFVLILPTTLMGGSLPVLSRCLGVTNKDRGKKLGNLYGVNTLGAVSGAVLTGFFLIEQYGLSTTVLIGAFVSVGIGVVALLYGYSKKAGLETKEPNDSGSVSILSRQSLIAYAISGFCAIAYEVLWTRVLLQTLPSSTYTFSFILILYLLGIALGSIIGSRLTLKIKSPVAWFGIVQGLLAISIIGSAILSENASFYDDLISSSWSGYLVAMVLKTAFLILIPCILMGSLFPIMVQWYRGKQEDIGNAVGKIYSVNTVGGILGSFCAGFLMIPFLGSAKSLILIATINLILGIFFIKESPFIKSHKKWKYVGASSFVIAMFLTFGFAGQLLKPKVADGYKQLFYKEGADANVGVYQSIVPGREDFKILKINGVYQSGGTDEHAMVVQRRQGHLPMLLHDKPDSVLVIGLATGITLSAIAEHQKVKHIDCIEIVSSQFDAALQFDEENQQVLSDKRVNVIIDDGRSYIKTSIIKYKLIVGDLFQISSAGTSAMYSVEHVHACKDHLSDDGIMVQYIPLQQISEKDLKSVIKSFVHVFPFVQVWITDVSAQKPVLAIAASPNMIRLNTSQINSRIKSSGATTLASVGYDNPYLILSQCIMQAETVKKYSENSPEITLDHPGIDFSAPRILTQPKDERIRLTISSLLGNMKPIRIEIPNENFNEILEELKLYTQALKSNLIAELALDMRKWSAAETVLNEIIQKEPRHFDSRRILGRTNVFIAIDLLKQGKNEAAISRLNAAKELGINDILITQLLNEVSKKSKVSRELSVFN